MNNQLIEVYERLNREKLHGSSIVIPQSVIDEAYDDLKGYADAVKATYLATKEVVLDAVKLLEESGMLEYNQIIKSAIRTDKPRVSRSGGKAQNLRPSLDK